MSLTDEQLMAIGWNDKHIATFREGEFDSSNRLPMKPPPMYLPHPKGGYIVNPHHEAYVSGYQSGESGGAALSPTTAEVMGNPENKEEMLSAEEKFDQARRREGAAPRKRTHSGR